MQARNTLKKIVLSMALLGAIFQVYAAPVSRVTDFSDGQVLTANQLNSEFNNLISGGINSINNANIADGAAIEAAKISADIKGDAIERDGTTGELSVKVDGTSIEISADNLQVVNGGVSTVKIADGAVTTDKIADGDVTFVKTVNRTPVQSTPGVWLPLGSVGYRDESLYSCNSTTNCAGVNPNGDLRVNLTVTGLRPVIFHAAAIPGETESYIELRVNSLAPVAATGGFIHWVREEGDAWSTLTTPLAFYGAVNGTSLILPCAAMSTVFYPNSPGDWSFGIGSANIGPGSNVVFTIQNCRVTAYEL